MQSNGRVPVSADFVIDGKVPARTLTPGSAEEIAEMLAAAAQSREGIAPIGGGTTLSLGNPIERYDAALCTTGLAAILEYEPMDLVVSVQAGARFGDVQAVLAEHGQRLPVETAFPERATIGGMIATARSGPRRLSSGSLRDLLIGMSVAHPSGTVTKCGGMVVKNVSGYDMPRVYHGSLGTLGVIVSANFKVVPRPRADVTLVSEPVSLDQSWEIVSSLQAKGLPFIALELMRRDRDWQIAVRGEGRETAVEALESQVRGILGSNCERFLNDESGNWWQSYVDKQAVPSDAGVTIRYSVRPRATASLVRAVEDALAGMGMPESHVWASPGLGTVMVSMAGAVGEDGSVPRIVEVLQALEGHATHTVVLSAPELFKRDRDVWGPSPDTLDLMRGLKEQFDPNRVLNPGRFIGNI